MKAVRYGLILASIAILIVVTGTPKSSALNTCITNNCYRYVAHGKEINEPGVGTQKSGYYYTNIHGMLGLIPNDNSPVYFPILADDGMVNRYELSDFEWRCNNIAHTSEQQVTDPLIKGSPVAITRGKCINAKGEE